MVILKGALILRVPHVASQGTNVRPRCHPECVPGRGPRVSGGRPERAPVRANLVPRSNPSFFRHDYCQGFRHSSRFPLIQRHSAVADAGQVAIVPAVDAADQVFAVDPPIRKQRVAMQAATVQYRRFFLVGPADYHGVNAGDQRICRGPAARGRPTGPPWRSLCSASVNDVNASAAGPRRVASAG